MSQISLESLALKKKSKFEAPNPWTELFSMPLGVVSSTVLIYSSLQCGDNVLTCSTIKPTFLLHLEEYYEKKTISCSYQLTATAFI
jgi:hypothetical protein